MVRPYGFLLVVRSWAAIIPSQFLRMIMKDAIKSMTKGGSMGIRLFLMVCYCCSHAWGLAS